MDFVVDKLHLHGHLYRYLTGFICQRDQFNRVEGFTAHDESGRPLPSGVPVEAPLQAERSLLRREFLERIRVYRETRMRCKGGQGAHHKQRTEQQKTCYLLRQLIPLLMFLLSSDGFSLVLYSITGPPLCVVPQSSSCAKLETIRDHRPSRRGSL